MVKYVRSFVKFLVSGAIMPTGRELIPTLKLACGVTVAVALLKLLKLPCYFSLSGCIVCILILIYLLHIEKSQYAKLLELERKGLDAVRKHSRDVQLRVKEVAERRQQNSGASNKDAGTVSSDEQSEEYDR